MGNAIEIINLSFSYEKKNIFSDFNAQFQAGKQYIIDGKSGSGKSTLFKLLTGYLNADSGEIVIGETGLKSANITSIRKQISYLPQRIDYLEGMRILDLLNLLFDEQDNYKETLKYYLNELEMDFNLSKPLSSYSGGELRRIELSLVLSKTKEISILDEPISSIDSDLRDKAIALIAKQEKVTILMSTHEKSNLSKYKFETLKVGE